MPVIPTRSANVPNLGRTGLMSVREQAAADAELARITLLGGQSIADSLQQIGAQATRAGAALKRERERIQIENETLDATEKLLSREFEIRQEVLEDPTIQPGQLEDAYLQRLGEFGDELLGDTENRVTQVRVRGRTAELARSGRSALVQEGTRRQIGAARSHLDQLSEEAARRAAEGDTTGSDVALSEMETALEGYAALLDEDERLAAISQAEERADLALVNRIIQESPEQAEAILAQEGTLEGLSPEKRQEAIVAAESAGRDARVIGLDRRIESGAATAADIEALADRGDLSPAERRTRIRMLRESLDEKATSVQQVSRVQAVIDGMALPEPTSPEYQKSVDRFYALRDQPEIQDLPVDQQLARVTQRAAQTLMLPTPVKNRLVGSLRALGPEALDAAETLETLGEMSPTMLSDFSDRDLTTASLIRSFAFSGRDTAVERARETLQQGEDVRRLRREALREELRAEGTNAEFLRGERGEVGGLLGLFGTEVEIPPGLAAEYDSFVRSSYELHGDLDVAREAGLQAMDRSWAVTRVGGSPRWMKWAPERVYGSKDGGPEDAAWIQADLETLVAEQHPDVAIGEVRIDSDVFTGRGGNPTYPVSVMTEEGPIALEGVRFQPDASTSPTLRAELAETLESARGKRERARFWYEFALDFQQAFNSLPRDEPSEADIAFTNAIHGLFAKYGPEILANLSGIPVGGPEAAIRDIEAAIRDMPPFREMVERGTGAAVEPFIRALELATGESR